MARIKVQLPSKSIASIIIPVRITDINYGNHVGNNAIVEIIHEARVQFLNQHGFTEFDAGGTALIMNELLVEYKNESFYKDLLNVKVFIGEINTKSFEIFYSIVICINGTEKIIAKAKTGMVCYNYQEKKVETLPDKLKVILFQK